MIEREIEETVIKAAQGYPIISILGPRQSGKTTLSKALFPQKPYVTLEDPDIRSYAIDDPRGFLDKYSEGAIFDEVQRVPDLLSYLQGMVDSNPESGRFVLTGSQHFLLMKEVSQSLAGRTAILTLLPLSLKEIRSTQKDQTANSLMHRGFYPRLHERQLDPYSIYRDYFQTYVERDLRSLLRVHDLQTFETFIRLCAGRIGQLLNLSSLANDAGISPTTARDWIGLLETSFIVFRLAPYHANIRKRLIKSPKLYFYDTGLASYLCGIEEERQLETHPLRGNFFENLIISDLLKRRCNSGRDTRLYFYRDSTGNEVDLLYPLGPDFIPIEIKSGKTVSTSAFKGLKNFNDIRTDKGPPGILVYGGNEIQKRSSAIVSGIWDLNEIIDTLSA